MVLSAETSISLLLLGVSIIYFLFPPRKINYFYGYPTRRSMKSSERWKTANKMAPKMMLVLSLFDAVLGYVVADILNYDFLYTFIILLVLEFAVLFYLVERKLGEIDPTESTLESKD